MITKEKFEFAPAKLNLSLDVIGRRDDGKHDLSMVMQSLAFGDDVRVTVHMRTGFLKVAMPSGGGEIFAAQGSEKQRSGGQDLGQRTSTVPRATASIFLDCKAQHVPNDRRNIAWKAAEVFLEAMGLRVIPAKGTKPRACKSDVSVNIHIKKRIPVAAGLAGGSSNAAAVLRALNHLLAQNKETPFTRGELCAMGEKVGADVPYCICGGTMLAEGVGEKLTALKTLGEKGVILVKPKIGVSTAEVFAGYDQLVVTDSARPNNKVLIAALDRGDMTLAASEMKNVLELVTIPRHPVIQEIKDLITDVGGAHTVLMSGSGPTVFAVYNNKAEAKRAYFRVRRELSDIAKAEVKDEFDLILSVAR